MPLNRVVIWLIGVAIILIPQVVSAAPANTTADAVLGQPGFMTNQASAPTA